MASHYRGSIAKGLKQFDNSSKSRQIYEDIAWAGLMGSGKIDPTTGLPTKPVKAWENLSKMERLKIINLINNYNKNGSKNCK